MNNTAFTFGALAFAFIVYITVKGDLPKWRQVIGV